MKNTDYYDMILTGEQKTMLFQKKNPLFTYIFTVIFSVSILIQASFPVLAAPEEVLDATGQAAQERLQLPVQTNELAFWPKGPAITAQSAILMEAETGTILYAKNIHEELYPASTTKMLTCLIAVENCALNETVNFTYEAVSAVPGDGSNMGMDAGEYITMEECLYGIMVASANEVANAVGEHVAGSLDGFAEMMNKRAAELGCQNTHFINANGLHAEDHYTSAYDLALIARAYFQNDVLRRIGNTASYHFIPSAGQPDDFYKTNKHGLINGTYSYEGIIGGKTGYTDNAGQTLVTGCEQAGMRLICVVMKEDSPMQFEDTETLFDYGYQNFTKANIADNDTRHIISNSNFFYTGNDIFGDSSPILSIAPGGYVVLPNMSDFVDLTSKIDYEAPDLKENEIAEITYYYHDTLVGSGKIIFSSRDTHTYEFNSNDEPVAGRPDNVIFINVKMLVIIISAVTGIMIFFLILHSVFSGRQDYRHERQRRKQLRSDKRLQRKNRKLAKRRRLRRRQR